MNMKQFNVKKIMLIPLLFSVLLTSCTDNSSDAKTYERYIYQIEDASLHMPKLEELGNYKKFKAIKKSTFEFFITDTIALFVEYDHDEYLKQLQVIGEKYTFLDGPKETIYDVSATVNGYDFKVSSETYWTYSHEMLLIGLKEDKIAYLYHYDGDLDLIDNLESFIKHYYSFK